MMKSLVVFMSLFVVAANNEAAAFAESSPKKSQASGSALNDLDVKQKSVAGMTKLRFQASTNYATQPVKCNDVKQLEEFCFCDEFRDTILEGPSSRNSVERVKTPSATLYRLWQVEAAKNKHGYDRPTNGDSVLRVRTTGIRFPGLTLCTLATVGCKTVKNKQNNPELQITMLGNELKAEGPKPLVWVFNQLTGANSDKANGREIPIELPLNVFPPLIPPFLEQPKAKNNSKFTTHSTNTITAEKTDDGVVFRSVARLWIDVSFPTLLTKILPVSKEMAERQGSNAIRNVVERDIGPALEVLRKRYIDFLEKTQH